jgi:hypothetical protein
LPGRLAKGGYRGETGFRQDLASGISGVAGIFDVIPLERGRNVQPTVFDVDKAYIAALPYRHEDPWLPVDVGIDINHAPRADFRSVTHERLDGETIFKPDLAQPRRDKHDTGRGRDSAIALGQKNAASASIRHADRYPGLWEELGSRCHGGIHQGCIEPRARNGQRV